MGGFEMTNAKTDFLSNIDGLGKPVIELKLEKKFWSVFDDKHINEMLHFVSERFYGVNCTQCKTTCCANQALEIQREEIKNMAKHLKMNPGAFRRKYTKTKEAYMQYLMNVAEKEVKKGGSDETPQMAVSKRGQDLLQHPGRIVVFEFSDDKINIGGLEGMATYCPFYKKDTHRCAIHEARPQACRDYPFLRVDRDVVEVRKASACVITDRFLERFIEFLKGVKGPEKFVEDLEKALASKEYFNHLDLPWILVLYYLSYEFFVHGMVPLAEDLAKRMNLEILNEVARKKNEVENAGTYSTK
jgi:Fe-S-cluster containining protein